MNEHLIFLSHIHEEKELAELIKCAIEDEFSGFVTVFVSSCNDSIYSGDEFVKKIEEALQKCSAAIFLISPSSQNRPWIYYELGALRMRKIYKNREEKLRIIPFCHSGLSIDSLKSPFSIYDSIIPDSKEKLKKMFESIQQSTLKKPIRLRCNFEKLRKNINEFEKKNTIYKKTDEIINLFFSENISENKITDFGEFFRLSKILSKNKCQKIEEIAKMIPRSEIKLQKNNGQFSIFNDGEVFHFDFEIIIKKKLISKDSSNKLYKFQNSKHLNTDQF